MPERQENRAQRGSRRSFLGQLTASEASSQIITTQGSDVITKNEISESLRPEERYHGRLLR